MPAGGLRRERKATSASRTSPIAIWETRAVGVSFAGVAAWSAAAHTFPVGCCPVIVGLLPDAFLWRRAPPGCELGAAARRAGLLVIPEEVTPPPVVATFNRLASRPPTPAIEPPYLVTPPALAPGLQLEFDDVA